MGFRVKGQGSAGLTSTGRRFFSLMLKQMGHAHYVLFRDLKDKLDKQSV